MISTGQGFMHKLIRWAMMSNLAEIINVALVSTRELSIFNFLEEVRLMFGRWNHENKHKTICTFTTLIGISEYTD